MVSWFGSYSKIGNKLSIGENDSGLLGVGIGISSVVNPVLSVGLSRDYDDKIVKIIAFAAPYKIVLYTKPIYNDAIRYRDGWNYNEHNEPLICLGYSQGEKKERILDTASSVQSNLYIWDIPQSFFPNIAVTYYPGIIFWVNTEEGTCGSVSDVEILDNLNNGIKAGYSGLLSLDF